MKRRRARKNLVSVDTQVSLTPLIDMAFVLLIIFMIATPMLNKNAIKVDLPSGSIQEGVAGAKPLVVTIDEKGNLFFNDVLVALEDLSGQMKTYLKHMALSADQTVCLRAHGASTNLNTFAHVYEKIKEVAGIKDIQIALQESSSFGIVS